MKILVLLTDLFDSTGGIQTFNRALIKPLDEIAQEKGFNIEIFVLNDKGKNELANKYLTKGISNYKAFSKSKIIFTLSLIKSILSSQLIIIGHINFLFILSLFELLKIKRNIHLVIYGIDAWVRLNPIQRYALSAVNNIISISNFTKIEMLSKNNLTKHKFSVLPCTLDPFYEQEIDIEKKSSLPKGKMILSVSRLDSLQQYKRIDLIIQSMPEILKEVPDAFYVIVGNGSDKKRLENLVEDLQLENRIIFATNVSNDLLPSYFKECDVFVLPSTKEGFGIVFLEAMYQSKVCIGANTGGIPEVIENNKTGLLCKPNDKSSLTEAITKLLKDENLRNEMGKSGKERLEKLFSSEKFKEKLENILCN